MKKNIIIIICFVIYCLNIQGQKSIPENLNLNQPLVGNTYSYEASKSITFSSGFSYKAASNANLYASIDPLNLAPNPYPNNIYGGADNGIVGKLPDELNITPAGQVSYEMPIDVPQGTGAMSPQLSIVYNSLSKDGLLGSGFDLLGLSMVNRTPSNVHTDGLPGYVNFTSRDKFMLDGQRLIYLKQVNSSTYEYRTENNNYSKIIASGTDIANPSTFTVYAKSGLIYEYGSNTSQLKSTSSTSVLFWLLRKVSDTKGNYYTISYDRDDANGEYWPIRMDYTGNDKTTPKLVPYASVRFEYTSNLYPAVSYIYGMKVKRSKILSRINIYSGETRLKYYQMSYQTVNNKRQLINVTEYASDGSKLNPTKFNWYNSSNFITTNVDYNTTNYISKAKLTVGDFNGDGKADFLVTPQDGNAGWKGWRIFLSNGNSFSYTGSGSLSLDGEIQEVVSGDFNGDGYADFVIKRKYNNKYYNSDLYLSNISGNSVSFTFSKCFISDTRNYSIRTVEVNGDGISDIFLWYHNSKDCKIIYSEVSGNTVLPLNYTATRNCSVNWDRVEFVDFNGDGLTDVMNLNSDGYYLLESDGYGTMSQTRSSTWPNKEHHLYLGDFNGDGKTDMLLTGWNKDPNSGGWSDWNVQFSKGDGTFERVDFSKKFNSKDKYIYVADIDGDGKDDFYAVDKTAGAMSQVYAYLNDGTGSYFQQINGASTYPADKWRFYHGDFNGDGKTDFLCTSDWNKSNWTGCQLFLVPESANNLLASITDGLGNITEISYKPMSNSSIHERGTTKSYPLTSFSANWYLVEKVMAPNGIGGKNTTSYKYKNALIHKRGRGPLGFEYFIAKDEINNIESKSQYEVNTEQYVTSIKYRETLISGKLLTNSTYTNKLKYYYSTYPRIFTFDVVSSVENKYEINTNTLYSKLETTNEYDDYGNPIKSVVKNGTDVVTNTNTYSNNESNWQISKLTSSVVSKTNGKETINRETSFTYKADGLLESETSEKSNIILGYKKNYVHDHFGNVKEVITTPNDTKYAARKVTYQYDSRGRVETQSSNSLGLVTKRDVNPDIGVVNYILDPNNVKTEYSYDSFGQLLFSKTPLGTTQTVKRWSKGHPDAPTNAVYFVYTESTGTLPVLEFFDGLGRSLRNVVSGFKTNEKIYNDVIYNSKGQIEKTSEPYFSGQTIYWNKNEYDLAGRTTKQLYPDGTYYSFQYNGLTTTTIDPLNQKATRILDALGRLIESRDNAEGTVKFAYNAAGNCVTVTGARTTIKSEYDIMGNKIKLIDPDLGTISYAYNAFGELISQTDSKGTISLKYDLGGRLIEESSSDGVISHQYDTKWKGSLTKSSLNKNNISETFEYDTYGRVIKLTETIDDKTFVTQTSYDTYNRVEYITYPTGLKIKQEYNNGHLAKVIDASTNKVYWQVGIVNARGQLEQITLGNQLTTTLKYNPEKGYLYNIVTPGIQNWTYQYNTVGNLTTRIDNSRNLTESFVYDKLNRLTSVSQNGQVKQNISYDAVGNITSKTGVGTNFVYENNSNKLLSVSGAAYNPPSWDEINYTPYNKISYIKQGTNSLTLVYGVKKERKKSVSVKNGTSETKYYAGSLYEEEYLGGGEVKKIHYIFGDGGAIAIYEKSNKSADKVRYLHKDHLGSIQVYSDETGKKAGELSYDAWGRRRNPDNWQYYANLTDAKAWHPRGFTGHEHLDFFEMINMNGRMYDPILGRFMSPDPYMQAPDYTQGLNRYSYCLDNPLSLVDLSGYSWFSKHWKSLVAGAVGVVASVVPGGQGFGAVLLAGAIGGAATGITGALLNGANFGNTLKSAIGGALSGFIGGVAGAIGGKVVSNAVNSNIWSGIKMGMANLALSQITPDIPIIKGSGWNVSISPVAMFTSGLCKSGGNKSTFRLGAGVSISKKIGDFTFSGGMDFYGTYGDGVNKNYNNFGKGTAFGGVGYDDGEYGVSLLLSKYYQAPRQVSGVLGIHVGDLQFNFEDDWFGKIVGQGADRWRTAAIEIQYKDLVVGVNVFTDDPSGQGTDESTLNSKKGVYKNAYQTSSPMYIGFRSGGSIVRYGYDKSGEGHGGFYGQNWWHRNFPGMATPDFKPGDYDQGFVQIGIYKPYTFY